MSDSPVSRSEDSSHELSIFVTDADRTGVDIKAMSNFMANRISQLTFSLIDRAEHRVAPIRPADIALINQALSSGNHVVQNGFEYLLDFDSLPKDVLANFRKGIYRLGESRQVDGNLRAVIVDQAGTRVKDLTLKREKHSINTVDNMQEIALQAQLRSMDAKLDSIIELQGYHIDFNRNNSLVVQFFNARDRVVHAQNETDPEKRRQYLDDAVYEIECAMNAAYQDIATVQKRFLRLTTLPIPFFEGLINQYIGYITQDLQLLARYNSVLLQILDYMEKKKDKFDAFEKYRSFLLGFYTKAVGRRQLPLSLQIHNAFDATQTLDKNIWKNMTDEMVPVLHSKAEINGAIIISVEDGADETR